MDETETHRGEPVPPLPGRSLREALASEGPLDDAAQPRAIYLEHEGHRGVRRGRWKLVALSGQPWELYDLASDPTELHDLSGTHESRVAEMAADWDRWAERNRVTPLPDDYQVRYLAPKVAKPSLKPSLKPSSEPSSEPSQPTE